MTIRKMFQLMFADGGWKDFIGLLFGVVSLWLCFVLGYVLMG